MKVPIVITGLVRPCYREIVEHYKDYECVWSTWKTEPEDRLDYIRSQKNITLDLIDIPDDVSFWQRTGGLQWLTTLSGFRILKERGHEFGIRSRSDTCIGIPSILSLTDYDSLNFISWHNGNGGYFMDYYFSGPVDDVCEVMENCIKTIEEKHFSSNTFGENILTHSILNKTNFRKINYTCSDTMKFNFIDHVRGRSGTIDSFLNHLKSGILCFKQDFPNDYQLL